MRIMAGLNIPRWKMSEPKQVIVVRKDLNMRKGKIAAQVAHASMKAVMSGPDCAIIRHDYGDMLEIFLGKKEEDPLNIWLASKFTKIVVGVDTYEEFKELVKKVQESDLKYKAVIVDSGATEFNGVPTVTCMALGPDWPEKLDAITGHLKLI